MPHSINSAEVTSIFALSGIRMAIVASGPTPGRMPTTVPRKVPTKQWNRFSGVPTTEKPSRRFSMILLSASKLKQEIFDVRGRQAGPKEIAEADHCDDSAENAVDEGAPPVSALRQPGQHQDENDTCEKESQIS